MADSFIGITEPAVPNKKLDSEQVVVGLNTVERERVQISGDSATDIAPVTAADGLLVKVSNTVPVSGTVSVTEPVSVDDNAGSLTVDAVNLDIRDLTFAADKVDVSGSTGVGVTGTFFQATQPVSAVSLPLPTGAATLAAQTQPGVDIGDVTINNGAGAAAVNIQDGGNAITVDGAVTVSGTATVSAIDLDIRNLVFATDKVDVSGSDVDVVTVPAPLSTTGGGTEATALRVTIANDSTGVLSVDDNGASLTVDNAALSVVGGGIEATALRVTIASDSTGVLSVDDNGSTLTVDQATASNLNAQVVGNIAHDTGASGNPIAIAGIAQNMDDTAPPNQVSAENDVTRIATDRDGGIFVHPHGPRIWSYHEDSSSALTDASVHAAPAAGLSLYVTDIIVSTGAATAFNVFFEEGASKVLGPWYLEAAAGRGLAISFKCPKKITAATALTVTTSAAIAHSIDVTGFITQG